MTLAPPYPAELIRVALIVVLVLVALGCHRTAIMLVVLWSGATAVSEGLKVIFRRVRPEAFFGYIEPVTYSFPSGHAIASACFYGAVPALITANTKFRCLAGGIF